MKNKPTENSYDDDDDFMFNDASTHWVICVYKVMFYCLKCKIYLNCTSKRLCYSLKIYIVLLTFGCLKRTRMEKFKILNGLKFKKVQILLKRLISFKKERILSIDTS